MKIIICPVCGKRREISDKYAARNRVPITCHSCSVKKEKIKTIFVGSCTLTEKKESRCDKNIFCEYYETCLSAAANFNWRGWSTV